VERYDVMRRLVGMAQGSVFYEELLGTELSQDSDGYTRALSLSRNRMMHTLNGNINVLECEAKAHNRLMHALNGNTEESSLASSGVTANIMTTATITSPTSSSKESALGGESSAKVETSLGIGEPLSSIGRT